MSKAQKSDFEIYLNWLVTGFVQCDCKEKGTYESKSFQDLDYIGHMKCMRPVVQSGEAFHNIFKCVRLREAVVKKIKVHEEDEMTARFLNNDYKWFKKYHVEYRKAYECLVPVLKYLLSKVVTI